MIQILSFSGKGTEFLHLPCRHSNGKFMNTSLRWSWSISSTGALPARTAPTQPASWSRWYMNATSAGTISRNEWLPFWGDSR